MMLFPSHNAESEGCVEEGPTVRVINWTRDTNTHPWPVLALLAELVGGHSHDGKPVILLAYGNLVKLVFH